MKTHKAKAALVGRGFVLLSIFSMTDWEGCCDIWRGTLFAKVSGGYEEMGSERVLTSMRDHMRKKFLGRIGE